MLAFMSGMFAFIFTMQYPQYMIFLGFLVPLSMVYMYKTSTYLEDLCFCLNDMNGLLILMTLSLALLILLSSWAISSMFYTLLHLSLIFILLLCFSLNNFFLFYVFFESSLLPILLMIVGWGYQPERLQASLYMIMYTVIGSMPLFVIILYIFNTTGSLSLFYLMNFYSLGNSPFFWLGLLAFLVKLPIWSLHVWLPKAHVEAPLGGSMILAGALLKLGGYGLYLFSYVLIPPMFKIIPVGMMSLAMWGGLIAAILCLCQSDIKSMIAYSSIVHMTLVVMGCITGTSWGHFCALVTMIAHGWTSSALFCVAFLSYEKVGSRMFIMTKGLLKLYPTLSLMWFLLTLTNMAVPPTINLVGELFGVPVSMWLNIYMLIILLLIMFLSVTYNMYLYTKINHGAVNPYILGSGSLSAVGMLSLIGHLCPLMLIFCLPCLY